MEEVTFLANGTRVAAVNPKTYIFQPEMSRGPESDRIRTVNIPAVVRDPNMTTNSWSSTPAHDFTRVCLVSDGDGDLQESAVGQSDLRLHEVVGCGPLHHAHGGRAAVGL